MSLLILGRKGSTVEVSNQNLDQVAIDMKKYWIKLERDKGADTRMGMRETYTLRCKARRPLSYGAINICDTEDRNPARHDIDLWTCSSPRRTFFLHALSFECTSKLCITFLNQFSVYFHI